jgi:hypothetical protein
MGLRAVWFIPHALREALKKKIVQARRCSSFFVYYRRHLCDNSKLRWHTHACRNLLELWAQTTKKSESHNQVLRWYIPGWLEIIWKQRVFDLVCSKSTLIQYFETSLEGLVRADKMSNGTEFDSKTAKTFLINSMSIRCRFDSIHYNPASVHHHKNFSHREIGKFSKEVVPHENRDIYQQFFFFFQFHFGTFSRLQSQFRFLSKWNWIEIGRSHSSRFAYDFSNNIRQIQLDFESIWLQPGIWYSFMTFQ